MENPYLKISGTTDNIFLFHKMVDLAGSANRLRAKSCRAGRDFFWSRRRNPESSRMWKKNFLPGRTWPRNAETVEIRHEKGHREGSSAGQDLIFFDLGSLGIPLRESTKITSCPAGLGLHKCLTDAEKQRNSHCKLCGTATELKMETCHHLTWIERLSKTQPERTRTDRAAPLQVEIGADGAALRVLPSRTNFFQIWDLLPIP